MIYLLAIWVLQTLNLLYEGVNSGSELTEDYLSTLLVMSVFWPFKTLFYLLLSYKQVLKALSNYSQFLGNTLPQQGSYLSEL